MLQGCRTLQPAAGYLLPESSARRLLKNSDREESGRVLREGSSKRYGSSSRNCFRTPVSCLFLRVRSEGDVSLNRTSWQTGIPVVRRTGAGPQL